MAQPYFGIWQRYWPIRYWEAGPLLTIVKGPTVIQLWANDTLLLGFEFKMKILLMGNFFLMCSTKNNQTLLTNPISTKYDQRII